MPLAPAPVRTSDPTSDSPSAGLLSRWWAARRERRYVGRRCRELLALSQRLQGSEPQLAGAALYRRIVAVALGGDAESIERVLEQAEHNYAAWPVSRPLSLRDVAHHIAVTEYFRLHAGTQQMRADDLKRLVDETIPGDL